jgi:hypothetical protein
MNYIQFKGFLALKKEVKLILETYLAIPLSVPTMPFIIYKTNKWRMAYKAKLGPVVGFCYLVSLLEIIIFSGIYPPFGPPPMPCFSIPFLDMAFPTNIANKLLLDSQVL